MVNFQETPLITSGDSLVLGGHGPHPDFIKIMLLLFLFYFFLSILYEYVESFIADDMLISIGLIQRYHRACKMEAYDPISRL
jgi:hypothetical protein